MSKKAVLYHARYAYDLGNVFVNEIGTGLTELGYEVMFLDLMNDADCRRAADHATYRDCDLLFSLNCVRPEPPTGDFRFFRDTGCVCFGLAVDPPLRLWRRLFWNHDLLALADRAGLDWIHRYLRLSAQTVFLPHGGSRGPLAETPWEQRSYPVVFTGAWRNPQTYLDLIDSFHPYVKNLLHDAIDQVRARPDLDPFAAAAAVLRERGNALEHRPDLFRLLCAHYSPLDNYFRAVRRLAVLQELDAAGIAVDLWGKRWPQTLFRHHRIHGIATPDEVNAIMGSARLVLNLGGFADGAHERIFTAMRNGAIAATETTPYLQENFTDRQDFCGYDPLLVNALPDRLNDLLNHPETAAAIAVAGQRKAEADHTWQHRARQIAALAETYRQEHSRGTSSQSGDSGTDPGGF